METQNNNPNESSRADRAIEDIFGDLYAKLFVHDAYIASLHAFIELLLKVVVTDEREADSLKKGLKQLIRQELDRVKKENSLLDDIEIEKAMREIKGISGIDFS